jgi:hypothetical protein
LALSAAGMGAMWLGGAGPPAAEVSPGSPLPDAEAVYLLPGTHAPFTVTRPGAVVEAAPGAVVSGPIRISADDVTLRDLEVAGGESGIVVERVEGAVLEGVTVGRAELHGIEVVDASARIEGCRVHGLRSPYGQGIEIRNASTRSPSVVEGCSITGGQEGLVTHSARVEFRENGVTGTTLRAIAITEMSEGVMRDNQVYGVTGSGLYCGDMSHCEIVGNTVREISSDGSGVRSRDGYAAVGWYHSTLRLRDNAFDVPPERRVRLALGTITVERFPLAIWPPGWRGALPALWVTGLSLVGLGTVKIAVAPWARRRRPAAGSSAPLPRSTVMVLAVGLVVTSFHMLEHIVQVFQVYVADAEHRSGLLGAWIDTEWVHFVYNLAVVGFVAWLWRLVRPGGRAESRTGATWALAALVIQGYHVVEHTAKMIQHLALGVKVAPGLLGGPAGLVWFHFGINLAVFVGLAVPVVAILRRHTRERARNRGTSAVPEPAPAA